MNTTPCFPARWAPLALALTLPGAALAGDAQFATTFNPGLDTALGSVGQNLLGSAVFGMFNPRPTRPPSPNFEFADNSALPIAIGIIKPPSPNVPGSLCRTALEVGINEGIAVLRYDPAVLPDGVPLVETDLSALVPDTSQCEVNPGPHEPDAFATAINPGLLNAFNSVGQDFLGTAVFGAVNPHPGIDPLRVVFAENSVLPVTIGIIRPPNPNVAGDTCRTYVAITIDNGVTTVLYDSNAAPEGFTAEAESTTLGTETALSQCPMPGT
jgi:hypothetical protein